MTVVTIAVVGITAVLLAVALKGMKGEYGTYLVMAAGFFIFFYGVGKLTTILDTIKQVQSYIRINSVYLSTLIKMIGITYVAEFAAGICRMRDTAPWARRLKSSANCQCLPSACRFS